MERRDVISGMTSGQALWRSGNNKSLRDKGVRDIKVHTVDSMQGSEAKMVILDMVLANKRTGRYGFEERTHKRRGSAEANLLSPGVECPVNSTE